jgi:hypothetical protein
MKMCASIRSILHQCAFELLHSIPPSTETGSQQSLTTDPQEEHLRHFSENFGLRNTSRPFKLTRARPLATRTGSVEPSRECPVRYHGQAQSGTPEALENTGHNVKSGSPRPIATARAR